MTSEQQLKAIIQAQVRGGYLKFQWACHEYYNISGINSPHIFWHECSGVARKVDESEPFGGQGGSHLLAILLDTEGAKAAYGMGFDYAKRSVNWRYATTQILNKWHSGKGSNWKAAIDTAYRLL